MKLFMKKSKKIIQEGLTQSHCTIAISRPDRNFIQGKRVLAFDLKPEKEASIWILYISSVLNITYLLVYILDISSNLQGYVR